LELVILARLENNYKEYNPAGASLLLVELLKVLENKPPFDNVFV
jgi:hypothetical protein